MPPENTATSEVDEIITNANSERSKPTRNFKEMKVKFSFKDLDA